MGINRIYQEIESTNGEKLDKLEKGNLEYGTQGSISVGCVPPAFLVPAGGFTQPHFRQIPSPWM